MFHRRRRSARNKITRRKPSRKPSTRIRSTFMELLEGREMLAVDMVQDGVGGNGLTNGPDIKPYVSDMTAFNGTLYFNARDNTFLSSLWHIDTTTGLAVKQSIGAFGGNPRYLTPFNGTLYFAANHDQSGEELWRLNPTTLQPEIVSDINPGSSGPFYPGGSTFVNSSSPRKLSVVGNTLFFLASGPAGRELYRVNSANQVELVEDSIPGDGIAPGINDAEPQNLTVVGNTLYFSAYDGNGPGQHGQELWKAGETGVAQLVTDITPEQNRSSSPQKLTAAGGTLFFRADDGVNGTELWRVNPTTLQAEMVPDIWPGDNFGTPNSSNPDNLTAVGNLLYFTAQDGFTTGFHGNELWRVGATGAASLVTDINPGPTQSSIRYVTNAGGTLFLAADDGTNGTELWRVSGPTAQAEMVEDAVAGGGIGNGQHPRYPSQPASGNPFRPFALGDKLYFVADDNSHGNELWRAGATGQAELVADIDNRVAFGFPYGSNPNNFANVEGTLYFAAQDQDHGMELWKVNNTTGQAEFVADARPGTKTYSGRTYGLGSMPGSPGQPSRIVGVNGVVYFQAYGGRNESPSDSNEGYELFRVGTVSPPALPEIDVRGNGVSIEAGDTTPAAADGTEFGSTVLTGGTVSRTFTILNTGTAALTLNGTPKVAISGANATDFTVGAQPGGTVSPGGNVTFQITFDPSAVGLRTATVTIGNDDSNEGTYTFAIQGSSDTWGLAEMVEDSVPGGGINPGVNHSLPSLLTNVNGTLYFKAFDEINGYELRRINALGQAELVEDAVPGGGINPGQANANLANLTNVNGTLYFVADDGTHGNELWRVNNATGLAEMVDAGVPGEGLRSGTDDPSFYGLTNVNGTLYFVANDGINGIELWRVTGPSAPAELVDDVMFPGGGIGYNERSGSPQRLTVVGNTLYFVATDGGFVGNELWRINASGLAEVVEDSVAGGGIYPGSNGSNPADLTSVNGTLYFRANDGVNGNELWRINASGQAEMVEDSVPGGGINVGSLDSFPANVTNVNGTLYFSASDVNNGRELWRINASGQAEMVGGGIRPGTGNSSPYALTNVNGTLYFLANDGTNGYELWRLNASGQAESASPGGGIRPGSQGGNIRFMTNVGGTLYFQANDFANGSSNIELWRVTGPTALAEMVEDDVPGGGIHATGNAQPEGLTDVNGTLFFRAFSNTLGNELFRINPSGQPVVVEDAIPGGGIRPGSFDAFPENLLYVNGTLYFRADDGVNGHELWRLKEVLPVVSEPEIDVKGNSVSISDGNMTPATTNDTDFGSANVTGGTVSHTFTIENTGSAALNLSGTPKVTISGANASDFTVTLDPASSVAAGGNTTFTVQFDPSANGTRTAIISIDNDDSNENPYNFSIQGTGFSLTPEIDVQGNGISIADGNSTPTVAAHSDFGSTTVTGGSVSRTFTILNTGSAALTLSGTPKVVIGGANAGDFSVLVQPASSVSSGGNTTFTVVFDPSAAGTRTATISIDNDDSSENPYNFSIQGSGELATSFGFDFNAAGSPTQSGYIGIAASDLYSAAVGYGWNVAPGSFDRGAIAGNANSDVLRDGHFASVARTFNVDLPNGTYWVRATLGDKTFARDQMQVNAEGGAAELTGLTTAAGQFAVRGFSVGVTGGQLNIEISDLGGANTDWVLNGLEIKPVSSITALTFDAVGSLTTDGLTIDTFTGRGATPNSLVTVSTSLGNLTSVDANTFYTGTQVQADAAGNFTVQVKRPASAGSSTVTAEELGTLAAGTLPVTYSAPTTRKFDFNSAGSPTQSGYIEVLTSALYTGGAGYGWDSAPGALDRGAIAGSVPSDLLRDGHFFSRTGTMNNGAKTFTVDLPDGNYWVNVTMGDKIIARDQMQVNAEGGAIELTGVATAAGQFVQRGFSVGVTGGSLELEISDLGGNADWIVNGLEIRPLADVQGTLTLTSPGALTSDGLTVTTFTGTGAAANSLVTIRSTVGTITGTDASTTYQDFQATTDANGNFTFSVQAPASAGSGTITAEELDGRRQASLSQSYTLAVARRFDFNASPAAGGTNVTAPGFTGLLGSVAYSAATGYGWVSTSGIGEFQRSTPAAALTSPLRRDGHFGTGVSGHTFQIAVTPGTEYNVRVFVGDYLIARSGIVVTVEGAAPYTIASLAAGAFDTRATAPTSSATGLAATADGLLTINIKQSAGGSWVANGIDIWEVGSTDPGAAAMLQVAASAPSAGEAAETLDPAALAPIVTEAIARWAATGISAQQLAVLQSTQFQVLDLGANSKELGNARPGLVQIDDNAAGYGWYIDSTPGDDAEFAVSVAATEKLATAGAAANHIDLLTLVMHELGHELGLEDLDDGSDPHSLMSENILQGTRRTPVAVPSQSFVPVVGAAAPSTREQVFASLAIPATMNAGVSSNGPTQQLGANALAVLRASRSGTPRATAKLLEAIWTQL